MYVGLDVHKKFTEIAILDESGVILKQDRIQNDPESVESFSKCFSGTNIVIESSSTWHWLYRKLSKNNHVVLSNPAKTKAIASAKVKTDRIDALMLANLLRGGYIAQCYVPSDRIMDLKELVRYRANLVRLRATTKNRIHAYLLMNNIRIEGSPFCREFVQRLKELGDYRVMGNLRIIDSINREIRDASARISGEAMADEDARRLMTIPGVSFYSALLMVSEIGDVSRFPESYNLVSYAGLAPSTHSSGGVTYHGHITKTGSPYLRWVLNQCTRSHMRGEPGGTVAAFYGRLARKKGHAIAITAASAKLLKIVYWVLKEKRPYHS